MRRRFVLYASPILEVYEFGDFFACFHCCQVMKNDSFGHLGKGGFRSNAHIIWSANKLLKLETSKIGMTKNCAN